MINYDFEILQWTKEPLFSLPRLTVKDTHVEGTRERDTFLKINYKVDFCRGDTDSLYTLVGRP